MVANHRLEKGPLPARLETPCKQRSIFSAGDKDFLFSRGRRLETGASLIPNQMRIFFIQLLLGADLSSGWYIGAKAFPASWSKAC